MWKSTFRRAAGLGGGSSDAACVLLALNDQWGLDWPVERLAALGLALGSDVPVFVHGRNAFASGRGERLTPLKLPPQLVPDRGSGVAVSTRELFAAPELTRDTPPLTIRALPADGGRNDFEPVVRARYPQVQAVFERLAPWRSAIDGYRRLCVYCLRDARCGRSGGGAASPEAGGLSSCAGWIAEFWGVAKW